jgi:hypothetical protein
MSPVELSPEKDCAGDAQQQLKTTDQISCQRGHPTSTNSELSKIIKERMRKYGRRSQMDA